MSEDSPEAPLLADDPASEPDAVGPWLSRVTFGGDGLVPVVAQDVSSGRVLMLAWTDRAGLERTLRTGEATYFSRSRREQWIKGLGSGHRQRVHEVQTDCDGDAIVYRVTQHGPACHTGDVSCFDAAAWMIQPGAQ